MIKGYFLKCPSARSSYMLNAAVKGPQLFSCPPSWREELCQPMCLGIPELSFCQSYCTSLTVPFLGAPSTPQTSVFNAGVSSWALTHLCRSFTAFSYRELSKPQFCFCPFYSCTFLAVLGAQWYQECHSTSVLLNKAIPVLWSGLLFQQSFPDFCYTETQSLCTGTACEAFAQPQRCQTGGF